MLKMRDPEVSSDTIFKCIGVELEREHSLKIQKRLENLRDKSPANSHVRFELEKRADSFVGKLSIKSITKSFQLRKASHDPFQTFLLVEKEAEDQLLEWKLNRFNLANTLTGAHKSLDKYG